MSDTTNTPKGYPLSVADKIALGSKAAHLYGQSDTHGGGIRSVGQQQSYRGMIDPEQMYKKTQSWGTQAYRSLVGGLAMGTLTAVEGTAYLGEYGVEVLNTIFDSDKSFKRLIDMDVILDSELAKSIAQEKQNLGRTTFKIYKDNPNKAFDWGDGSWWWSSAQSVLDSAVGFGAVGGVATKGVGLAQAAVPKLAQMTTRSAKLANFLRGSKVAQNITNAVGAGVLTNYVEGQSVGMQIYREVLDKNKNLVDLYNKSNGKEGISEEEAERRAAHAANAFKSWNRMFILTDAVSLWGIFKGSGLTRARQGLAGMQGFKDGLRNITKLSKKNPILKFATQGSTEAAEEIIQGINQKIQTDLGVKGESKGVYEFATNTSAEQRADIMKRALNQIDDPHTLYEGFLGFFGGGPQKLMTEISHGVLGKGEYWKMLNERHFDQEAAIKSMQNYFASEAGRSLVTQNIIADAAAANREELAPVLAQAEFARLATTHFAMGTTEALEQQLQEIANNKEFRSENGYQEEDAVRAKEMVRELKRMEKQWLRSSTFAVNDNHHAGIFNTTENIRILNELGKIQDGKISEAMSDAQEALTDVIDSSNYTEEQKTSLKNAAKITDQGFLEFAYPGDLFGQIGLDKSVEYAKINNALNQQAGMAALKEETSYKADITEMIQKKKEHRTKLNSLKHMKAEKTKEEKEQLKQQRRADEKDSNEDKANRKKDRKTRRSRARVMKEAAQKATQKLKKKTTQAQTKKAESKEDPASIKKQEADNQAKKSSNQSTEQKTETPSPKTITPEVKRTTTADRTPLLKKKSGIHDQLTSGSITADEKASLYDELYEVNEKLNFIAMSPYEGTPAYKVEFPESVKQQLDSMLERSSRLSVSKDQDQYILIDKEGNEIRRYNRVSNYIKTEPIGSNEYMSSAFALGSVLDKIIRDFFAGNLKPREQYSASLEGKEPLPVFKTNQVFENYLHQLENLKINLLNNGEYVITPDIKENGEVGEITLADDELGVAGTVDLMTVDKEGVIRIYDVKSMRSNNLATHHEGKVTYYARRFGNKKSDSEKHQEQLSMYRILLERTTDLLAAEIGIIPILIGPYEPGDTQIPFNVTILTEDDVIVPNLRNNILSMKPLNKVKDAKLKNAPKDQSNVVKESATEEQKEAAKDKAIADKFMALLNNQIETSELDQSAIADTEEENISGYNKNERKIFTALRERTPIQWTGNAERVARHANVSEKEAEAFLNKMIDTGVATVSKESGFVRIPFVDLNVAFYGGSNFTKFLADTVDTYREVVARINRKRGKDQEAHVAFMDVVDFIQDNLAQSNIVLDEKQFRLMKALYTFDAAGKPDVKDSSLPTYEDWLEANKIIGEDIKDDPLQYDESTQSAIDELTGVLKRAFELPENELRNQGTRSATDKIAYLARQYSNEAYTDDGFSAQDLEDRFNEGKVHPDIFDITKLTAGTKIKFKVNPQYTGVMKYRKEMNLPDDKTYDNTGAIISWESFKETYGEGTTMYNNYVPIEIRTMDDKLIGWYHNTGFVNKHSIRVGENEDIDAKLTEVRNKLSSIRRVILKSADKNTGEFTAGGTLRITERFAGQLIKPANKKNQRTDKALKEDLDITVGDVFGEKGGLRIGPKSTETWNTDRMHHIPGFKIIPGVTYVMFPVKYDKDDKFKTKYAPVPLYKDTLESHENIMSSIVHAIDIYTTPTLTDFQDNIRERVKDLTGLNLKKWEDVKFYISQFINDRAMPKDVENLEEYVRTSNLDDGQYIFSMKYAGPEGNKRNQIIFGNKMGAGTPEFLNLTRGKQLTSEQRQKLKEMLPDFYMNTSLQGLRRNKPVFTIAENGKVERAYETYKDMIKGTSTIPFVSMPFTKPNGEQEQAYVVQSVITINADQVLFQQQNEEAELKRSRVKEQQTKTKYELTYKEGALDEKIKQYNFGKLVNEISSARDSENEQLVQSLIDVFTSVNNSLLDAVAYDITYEDYLDDINSFLDSFEGTPLFERLVDRDDLNKYFKAVIEGTEMSSLLDLVDYRHRVLFPTKKVKEAMEVKTKYGLHILDELSYEAAKDLSNLVNWLKKNYPTGTDKIKPEDLGKLIKMVNKSMDGALHATQLEKIETYVLDVVNEETMSLEDIYTVTRDYTISPLGKVTESVERSKRTEDHEINNAQDETIPASERQAATDEEVTKAQEILDKWGDEDFDLYEDLEESPGYGFTVNEKADRSTKYIEGMNVLDQGTLVKNTLAKIFEEAIYAEKGNKVDITSILKQQKQRLIQLQKNLVTKAGDLMEDVILPYKDNANFNPKTDLDVNEKRRYVKALRVRKKSHDLKKAIKNWDKLEELIKERLENTIGFKIKDVKRDNETGRIVYDVNTPTDQQSDTINQDDLQGDSTFEKKTYDAQVGEVDPKASTSPRLKMFLSTITDSVITNGEIRNKQSWYEDSEYVNFDEVWNFLKEVIAGHWGNRKDVISELENHKNSHPFVTSIIDLLQTNSASKDVIAKKHLKKLNLDPIMLERDLSFRKMIAEQRAGAEIQKKMQIANELLVAIRSSAINMQMVIKYSSMFKGDSMDSYRVIPANRNKVDKKIRDQWTIALKRKNLYEASSEKDTRLYPNKERIDKLFNLYAAIPEPSADSLRSFLYEIGITLSEEVWEDIERYGGIPKRGGFEPAGQFLKTLVGLKGIRAKFANNLSIEESNPLNDGYIQTLSRMEAKYNKTLRPQSSRAGDKSIYEYTTTQFNIDQLKELQQNEEVIKNYKRSKFAGNSLWIEDSYLTDAQGNLVVDKRDGILTPLSGLHDMEFFTMSLNPYKDRNDKRYKGPMQDRTDLEHEKTKIGMFQEGYDANSESAIPLGDELVRRKMTITYPTNSNKERITGFKNVTGIVTRFSSGTELHRATLDLLVSQLVQPEVERIVQVQALIKSGNTPRIKAYAQGGQLFHFVPSLNNREELWDKSGTLKSNILSDATLRSIVEQEVRKHVAEVGEKKYEFWKQTGIGASEERETKSGGTFKKHYEGLDRYYMDKVWGMDKDDGAEMREIGVRKAAIDMEVNYMIANANMFMLFIGDPAQYFKAEITKKLHPKDPVEFIRNFRNNLDDQTRMNTIIDVFDNVGKRLAADIAPGYELADTRNPDKANELAINYMFVDDTEVESESIEFLKRIGLGDKVDDYRKIEGADAQEYVHWSEHLKILLQLGRITQDKHDELYSKLNRGKRLRGADLSVVLQPMKPVYVNNRWDESTKSYIRTYVKTSAFPLLPQVTKGLEMHKLTEFLEEQFQNKGKTTIHRVAMMSGTKVGGIADAVPILNKDKTFKSPEELTDPSVFTEANHIITVPRQGFRIQQDVPYKRDKDEINRVSQAAKLLVVNMLKEKGFEPKPYIINKAVQELADVKHLFEDADGNPLREVNLNGEQMNEIYNKIFHYLYEDDLQNFEKQFFDESGDINMEELRTVIRDEAISRNYPPSMVEAIDMFDDLTFLKFTPYALQFQALLNSLVNNRVIKKTMPGHSYVLGSEEGFRLQEGLTEEDLKNTDIITTANFNGSYLLPARYLTTTNATEKEITDARENNRIVKENQDGIEIEYIVTENNKKIMRGDQVFVAPRIKIEDENGVERLINLREKNTDGNYKWLKEQNGRLILKESKFSKQALELFGMRIPNQGPNSTAYIEIAGFLPETMGDLIIAPRDFTKRMGSDFDVDKLYTYQYFYSVNKRGKVVAYNGDKVRKQMKNALVNIHMSIATNPNEEVQRAIAQPLDEWELKTIGNEILNMRQNRMAKRDPNTGNVIPSNASFSGITSEYQRTKYTNARAGKIGVGVFSQDSVFNALGQTVKIDLRRKGDDGRYHPVPETFGTKKSKVMFTTDTVEKGVTKSQIISAWQSAAVDDEKLQVLYKMNVNSTTMPVVRYMNQIGFTKETPYFLAQDAMFDYISYLNKGMKRSDAVDEVFKKYEIVFPDDADALKEYKKDLWATADSIGVDELKTMIREGDQGETYTPEAFNKIQGALFFKFLDFTKKGEYLGDIQRKLGRDTKTVGKNLLETMTLQEDNEEKVKGLSLKNEDRLFKETSPGWVYTKALPTAMRFDTLFEVQSPLVNEVYRYIDNAVRWNLPFDVKEDIYKGMISYLYSRPELGMYDGDVVSARKRLFFDGVISKGLLWDRTIEMAIESLRKDAENSSNFVIGQTSENIAIEYIKDTDTYVISSGLSFTDVTSMMEKSGAFEKETGKTDFYVNYWKSAFDKDLAQVHKFVVLAQIYAKGQGRDKISGKDWRNALSTFLKIQEQNKVVDNPLDPNANANVDFNKSIATIFSEIMTTSYVRNNPFLMALTADINEQGISKLTFSASEGTLLHEKIYTKAFLDMFTNPRQPVLGVFNGIEYTPKRLGQELIKYAMVSGAKQEAIEFTKYIPPSVLYNMPLTSSAGGSIKNLVESASLYNSELFQNFKYQYLQHNADRLMFIDSKLLGLGDMFKHGQEILPEVIKKADIDFASANLKTEEGEVFTPSAFSVRETKGEDPRVVIYIHNGADHYIKVESLGTFGMVEYDPSKMFARSSINTSADVATEIIFEQAEVFKDLKKLRQEKQFRPLNLDEYERIINNKFMNDISTPDVVDLLTEMSSYTRDPYQRYMLEKFAQMAIATDLTYSVNELHPKNNTPGTYYDTPSHRINIDQGTLDTVTTSFDGNRARAFNYLMMHELTHAFTHYFLRENPNHKLSTKMGKLYNTFKDQIDTESEQWKTLVKSRPAAMETLNDLAEFIAFAGSDPDFQMILAGMKADKGTIFEQIVAFFKDALSFLAQSLNMPINKTLLDATISNILEIQSMPASSTRRPGAVQYGGNTNTNVTTYEMSGQYYEFTFDDFGNPTMYRKGRTPDNLSLPASYKGERLREKSQELYQQALDNGSIMVQRGVDSTANFSNTKTRPSIEDILNIIDQNCR